MSTDPHPDGLNPGGDPSREAPAASGNGFVGGDQDGWQAPDAGAFTGTSPFPYPSQGSPQGSPYPGYGNYQTPLVGQPGPPPGYPPNTPGGQPGYGAYGGQGPAGTGYPPPGGPAGPGAYGAPGYGGYASVLAPKPSIIPLRPLSIGEILGGSFESLRANPKAMFIPSLVVMTILGIISALGTTYFFDRLGASSPFSSSTSQPDTTDLEKQWSSLFGLYAQSGVNSILTMFASSILTGLLIVTVSRTILGRKASLSDVWQRTKPRVWALIGQAVIIQLIFIAVLAAAIGVFLALFLGLRIPDLVDSASPDDAVGTILLTILGLLVLVALVGLGMFALYCKLSLAPAALILENVGVFEGISRSWALTRGYFWRVVGIQILSFLIMSFASAIVTTPISMLAGVLTAAAPSAQILALGMSVLLGNIVTAATLPFDSAVNALIYTDLRMRSEGLDVELRRAAGV
ncbi:hypothetical protein ATCC27039_16070 [Actinomyces naeslundii]|nr:hypothetical protein [Actinomyces naeslundii]BDH77481.1 hypothetical protein ATCC27039_16070 [Actinomyces naeslundii]